MGESIVLAAGRPTPPIGPVRERGEGVAIVLSGSAVAAWKAGGSVEDLELKACYCHIARSFCRIIA